MPDTATAGQTDPVANTKVRHIRVETKLWDAARDVATDQHETVADVVRRALAAYVVDPNATNAALAQVRGGAR
jgi:hypothetical protein